MRMGKKVKKGLRPGISAEDFIAQNLNAIDVAGRKLRLYVDPTGRDGMSIRRLLGPSTS
jgi:hypothetical protein